MFLRAGLVFQFLDTGIGRGQGGVLASQPCRPLCRFAQPELLLAVGIDGDDDGGHHKHNTKHLGPLRNDGEIHADTPRPQAR